MWDTILVLKNIPIIVHVVVKMRNHRTVHPLYTIIKKYTLPTRFIWKLLTVTVLWPYNKI